jgi:4-amino-4-deoxy-L-arabinose transferase-like glycosyltransferase
MSVTNEDNRWLNNGHLKSINGINCALTALLFITALFLFSINNNFILGLHPDEVVKVNEIVTGQFNYRHPLLMIEITRLAAVIFDLNAAQVIVEIGRWLSALIGAIGVAAIFVLLRQRMSEATSVIFSLAAMTTPLVAIHAHYLKEDCWLFGFCALALLAFLRLARAPKELANIVRFGLCLGLAISSKAAGLFLIPVFSLTALLQAPARRRPLLISVALACGVAIAVVAIINVPALFHAPRAWTDFSSEIKHIGTGHWDGVTYPFGFHLTDSLWEGVGPSLLTLGVLGLALVLWRWQRAELADRLMVVYTLIYYAVIEATPLKAWPDPGRYALPLVLPLAYFAGATIDQSARWLAKRAFWPATITLAAFRTVVTITLVPNMITGLRLVAGLADDTRIVVGGLLVERRLQVATENYGTSFGIHVSSIAEIDLCRIDPNIRYLVASSFQYGRFAFGAFHSGASNADARAVWKRYQAIFRIPYHEVRPYFKSYAFSNPIIRVVDLEAVGAANEHREKCEAALRPD